ncbi:MAG TPA: hypothetical protein VH208_12655, partial [Myxococcaceae bacterium]|nr:hypothetical protein [Myxococcaceae bacterium]
MLHAAVLTALVLLPDAPGALPEPTPPASFQLRPWHQLLAGALAGTALTLAGVGTWEALGPVPCPLTNDRCTPFLWSGEADPRGLLALVLVLPPLGAALGAWAAGLLWGPALQGPWSKAFLASLAAHLLSPL